MIAEKALVRVEQWCSPSLSLDLVEEVAGRLDDLGPCTMARRPTVIAGAAEPIPFQIGGRSPDLKPPCKLTYARNRCA